MGANLSPVLRNDYLNQEIELAEFNFCDKFIGLFSLEGQTEFKKRYTSRGATPIEKLNWDFWNEESYESAFKKCIVKLEDIPPHLVREFCKLASHVVHWREIQLEGRTGEVYDPHRVVCERWSIIQKKLTEKLRLQQQGMDIGIFTLIGVTAVAAIVGLFGILEAVEKEEARHRF